MGTALVESGADPERRAPTAARAGHRAGLGTVKLWTMLRYESWMRV